MLSELRHKQAWLQLTGHVMKFVFEQSTIDQMRYRFTPESNIISYYS